MSLLFILKRVEALFVLTFLQEGAEHCKTLPQSTSPPTSTHTHIGQHFYVKENKQHKKTMSASGHHAHIRTWDCQGLLLFYHLSTQASGLLPLTQWSGSLSPPLPSAPPPLSLYFLYFSLGLSFFFLLPFFLVPFFFLTPPPSPPVFS